MTRRGARHERRRPTSTGARGARQNQENHDGVSFDDGRAELWKAVCDAAAVVDDGAWSDYVRCHDGVDDATLLEEVPVLGTEPWTPSSSSTPSGARRSGACPPWCPKT